MLKKFITSIIKPISFISIITCVSLFLRRYYTISIIQISLYPLILLFTGITCIVLVISYINHKFSNKKSFILNTSMLTIIIIHTIVYSIMRGIISTPQMESWIMKNFSLNQNGIEWFRTSFSMGYGFMQLFIGHIINKFGYKYISIKGMVAALLMAIMFYFKKYPIILHGLLGMIISGVSNLYIYYINKININKHYTQIANINMLVISVLGTFSVNQIIISLDMNILSPNMITMGIFFTMLGSSIGIFILSLWSDNNQQVSENPPSYLQLLKYFLNTKIYVIFFIKSILIIIAAWTLRDNFLQKISQLSTIPYVTLKSSLETGYLYGAFAIIGLTYYFRVITTILIFNIINITSILIICFSVFLNETNTSIDLIMKLKHIFNNYLLCPALFSIHMGAKAHLILQIYIGHMEKNIFKASGIISFINFGVTFIGLSSICQKLMPNIDFQNVLAIFIVTASISLALCVYLIVNRKNLKKGKFL